MLEQKNDSLTRCHRKSLKQGIRHAITHCSCEVENHIGLLKFVIKANGKDEEDIKLIGIVSCEEIMPEFTTRFYKNQVKNTMKIVPKSKLMLENIKSSCLEKVFVDQLSINTDLRKIEIDRLVN